jgi:hypothetical protein
MTAPWIRIDSLVLAGLDQASVQPERLRSLLAQELARQAKGEPPAQRAPQTGPLRVEAAPDDMRAVARAAAAAILGAIHAERGGRS